MVSCSGSHYKSRAPSLLRRENLLAGMKARAGTAEDRHAFMGYWGTRGTGPTAWATCQKVEHRERVGPEIFGVILSRALESYIRGVAFGKRCHKG